MDYADINFVLDDSTKVQERFDIYQQNGYFSNCYFTDFYIAHICDGDIPRNELELTLSVKVGQNLVASSKYLKVEPTSWTGM